MSSTIMNGKLVAAKVKETVSKWIERDLDRKPRLAIISIGDDDASKVYVRNKLKAAIEVGIQADQHIFTSKDYHEHDFYDRIDKIIAEADGVILQLPVPSWFDAFNLIERIPFWKDVDGLTTMQKGKFEQVPNSCHILDCLIPCTAQGIIELIDEYVPSKEWGGKNALVIGRSELVGKPTAKMLMDADMTVTIAHSKTPKKELCRLFANADIVVSAAGKRNLITEEDTYQYFKDNRHDPYGDAHFKRNRIIVDVSINRDENGKLCGDFSEDFKKEYSEYYTPVPGGVGPMTVAMLMFNVYMAAKDGPFWERHTKNIARKVMEE